MMHWDSDALWSKAKAYMDRALSEGDRTGPLFPFWASLALEFLARSALASVHPVLLAEPDREMTNVLYALGKASAKSPRSIPTSTAFAVCRKIIPGFTDDDQTVCNALADRRNEELHSGGLPFEAWPLGQWLGKFYRAAETLSAFQQRRLEDFLGAEEAAAARRMNAASDAAIRERVRRSIAAHKAVFSEKPIEEKNERAARSKAHAEQMSYAGGHRVKCPACDSVTFVRGEKISQQQPKLEEDQVVVRAAMLPVELQCGACDLKLGSHAELSEAGLGGQYTRTTYHDPVEFYGGEYPPEQEYDNE